MVIDKFVFLQNIPSLNDSAASGKIAWDIAGIILAFFFVFLIIIIGLYIYTSLAYSAIAKKARLKTPGLAWIPGVGPTIIAYQSSKMHWWPWLLFAAFFIPFAGIIAVIVFVVYSTIWHWKMLEVIGKPGWWALLMLIPIVSLVMVGIAAWSKK